MGMSASQARLLSITKRLTNNEYRAQTITNSKLRLAEKSQEATAEYMDALSSQKLMFGVYDDDGDYTGTDLTAAVMYDYAPMKNQYALVKPSGKMLVSAKDAKNYENTNSLSEFLKCYGLIDSVSGGEENPEYAEWLKWYSEWKEKEPVKEDYTTTKTITTEETIKSWVHTDSAAYDALSKQIALCFSFAKNGQNCFMHVLSALVGVGEHTTSSGETFEVHYIDDIAPDGNSYGWAWNTYRYDEEIGGEIRSSLFNDEVYDKPYEGELNTEAHGVVNCFGTGEDAAQYNSPWDPATGKGGYCYQKAIDLLYSMKDSYMPGATGGTATPENLAKFFYFVEFDLGNGYLKDTLKVVEQEVIDEESYNKAHEEWEAEGKANPAPPEKIESTELMTVNDKNKAQWYINLWYKMEGSETANKVKQKKIFDEKSNLGATIYYVSGRDKMAQSGNYEIFDDNLFKSAEWLQFAIEHGVVSMYQAQYFNPSASSAKVPELKSEGITWNAIVYTNAMDITSVDDDIAVEQAEVKYKKAITELKQKDNKFDKDLKNLDTEHNALQVEYEAIKEIINKNTDRSFKTFS